MTEGDPDGRNQGQGHGLSPWIWGAGLVALIGVVWYLLGR
jgi:hypothetical protein